MLPAVAKWWLVGQRLGQLGPLLPPTATGPQNMSMYGSPDLEKKCILENKKYGFENTHVPPPPVHRPAIFQKKLRSDHQVVGGQAGR